MPLAARPRKFSYHGTKVLQRLGALRPRCGKYLAVAMPSLLAALERHGEPVPDRDRHSRELRAELTMSATTIYRLPGAGAVEGSAARQERHEVLAAAALIDSEPPPPAIRSRTSPASSRATPSPTAGRP